MEMLDYNCIVNGKIITITVMTNIVLCACTVPVQGLGVYLNQFVNADMYKVKCRAVHWMPR
jgi:hypothetical protein